MAELNKSDLEARYNHVSTGLFKANATQAISSSDLRDFVTYLLDSIPSNLDDFELITTSTAGATITLDFSTELPYQRRFIGSATFATAKTITLTNSTKAKRFIFTFEITDVAAVLTLPSTFKSADVRKSGNDWTAIDIGQYKMVGDYNGTDWNIDITGPYA